MYGINPWFKEPNALDFVRNVDRSIFSNDTSPMKADILDHDDHFMLIVEVPGFEKEDISLTLKEDVLRIQTQMSVGSKNSDDRFIHQERYHSSQVRCFNVKNIDEENIKATFHNGILTVILPKSSTELPDTSKNIQIN